MRRIFTVGHGTLPAEDFTAMLHQAGVTEIVDVRSYPGSRHNPQFGTDEMRRWLPETGIAYSWQSNLGGRRKVVPESKHTALRHPSFRAYADHMETESFRSAIEELLSTEGQAAVMCSESVWWRCHRRLIADHLVLACGVEVQHLMHDGRLVPHAPTDGVRLDGHLIYDMA